MPYTDRDTQLKYLNDWYQQNKAEHSAKASTRRKRKRSYRKRFVDRYKALVGCVRCGYKTYVGALDLHHVKPSDKVLNVSRMVSDIWPMRDIKNEIRKCVVLCTNCHREAHSNVIAFV